MAKRRGNNNIGCLFAPFLIPLGFIKWGQKKTRKRKWTKPKNMRYR